MLLIASYIFYSFWDWRFSGLLLLSTIFDYYLSLAIYDTEKSRRRKQLLVASLLINFGILVFFKYFNFFVDSFGRLLGILGIQPHLTMWQIVLPAGISFYTFQTMNYTIDVYRKKWNRRAIFSIMPCSFPIFRIWSPDQSYARKSYYPSLNPNAPSRSHTGAPDGC